MSKHYVFRLPDIGEGTAEAELVALHVGVGDAVEEDQPLADLMTDKATVEIPSPVSGRVLSIAGSPGERLAVGSEFIVLQLDGEGAPDAADAAAEKSRAPQPGAAAGTAPTDAGAATGPAGASVDVAGLAGASGARTGPAEATTAGPSRGGGGSARPELAQGSRAGASGAAPATASVPDRRNASSSSEARRGKAAGLRAPGERPLASPAVRRRAWELGVGLQFVPGRGPGGRVTREDLDAFVADGGQPVSADSGARAERHGVEAIKVIGLRRAIAERMQNAKRRIPHFSYVEEVDVSALEELRAQLNARFGEARGRLTLLPFLACALARALPDHPQVNARFDDEAGVVQRFEALHLGIATQTRSGLVVPVVRHVEAMELWALAAEIARLAESARSGRAAPGELSGSTLTLSSLGRLGGLASTPVINHPEVAIVGVNRIVERPVVRDGQVVVRRMMNLSCSFDHRVVDGWDAAEFVQSLCGLLEQPALLLVS